MLVNSPAKILSFKMVGTPGNAGNMALIPGLGIPHAVEHGHTTTIRPVL